MWRAVSVGCDSRCSFNNNVDNTGSAMTRIGNTRYSVSISVLIYCIQALIVNVIHILGVLHRYYNYVTQGITVKLNINSTLKNIPFNKPFQHYKVHLAVIICNNLLFKITGDLIRILV